MIRKFKCKNCNHVYEADELNPNCVNCGSDNVAPYKPVSPAVIALLFAVVGLGVGFGCVKAVSKIMRHRDIGVTEREYASVSQSDGAANVPVAPSGVKDSNVGNGEALMEVKPGKPEIVSVSLPVYANGSYKFEVKATTESGDKLVFNLYAAGKSEPVAYSADGNFKNIPPAEDETGVYTLEVRNTVTNEYTSRPVSGFLKQVEQKTLINKLSAMDLQKMFNSGNIPASVKPNFAHGYKIVCSGLAEDESAPDRYEEIVNRLIASWSRVEVTNVKYNDKNQITVIYINVIY